MTWSINNGVAPLPTGTPTCEPVPATSTNAKRTTTTTTTTTTTKPPRSRTPTTTVDPSTLSTQDLGRYEAHEIVVTTKSRLGHLNFKHLRLQGQYLLSTPTETLVVDVTYARATVQKPTFNYQTAFEVPPAQKLTCLDPAFN